MNLLSKDRVTIFILILAYQMCFTQENNFFVSLDSKSKNELLSPEPIVETSLKEQRINALIQIREFPFWKSSSYSERYAGAKLYINATKKLIEEYDNDLDQLYRIDIDPSLMRDIFDLLNHHILIAGGTWNEREILQKKLKKTHTNKILTLDSYNMIILNDCSDDFRKNSQLYLAVENENLSTYFSKLSKLTKLELSSTNNNEANLSKIFLFSTSDEYEKYKQELVHHDKYLIKLEKQEKDHSFLTSIRKVVDFSFE